MRRLAVLLLVLALSGCSGSASVKPVRVSLLSGTGPVVVTLGDSVPAGSACDCTPFPDLYAQKLSPAGRSVNLAQGGYTTTDVQAQIADADVQSDLRAASVVLVMIGANDLAATFAGGGDDSDYQATANTVESNVQNIVATIELMRTPPVTVLVLGYWNVVKDGAVGLAEYGAVGLDTADAATQYCNQALRQAAQQSGGRYLATTPIFKGPDRDHDPTGLLASDGDHPNAAGHEAIANAVFTAVPHA